MFYGESSAADIFQRLTLARKLAVESNLKATEKGKEYHDRKAKPHTYNVGQKVLLEEYVQLLEEERQIGPKMVRAPLDLIPQRDTQRGVTHQRQEKGHCQCGPD
jgi:hypothetical protein